MVESDEIWEDEDEDEDEDDYENTQSYLNEESVFSQQGGDASNSSSDSWCPIGLRLNKTPSFLDMVQMSVAKAKSRKNTNDHLGRRHSMSEKLKAGNFPAASIKIGNWQRCSRHEGDLTAKIYYAKRKLVWEVLQGTLKYKIEMQWSDISAIRATTPENQLGTLEVELSKPPLYFQEINPQPKKHTLWQQASDFTGGQAPVWRRHIVSFNPGILDKHYKKLLQCNQRLFEISLKPFPSHESPYFNPTFGISEVSLSFSKPYESSYYQGMQYPYQSYSTLPPSMPVMNLSYSTNEGANMDVTPLWDEGQSHNINQAYDHNSEYPNYYEYEPANVGILGEIENHLVQDQSHGDEPSMGSVSEPTDVINPGYSYANYSSTDYQFQDAGNAGFYAHQQPNWNTPAQQYPHNNGVMNYQGTSSLDSYYYPRYNPTGGNF